MLGHGRISFETPNVIDPGDSVPSTPARSLQKDFENRGSASRVSITHEEENDRIIFKPNLSRSIKINYEDDADDEPTERLMPVNLDPEYGESKEDVRSPSSPTMEQTRLFAAAMLSESERRGTNRTSVVKNLFKGRRRNGEEETFLRDGLGLDYPNSAMEKWRSERKRRCRYAIYLAGAIVALFTVFGLFMSRHADVYGDRMARTTEFLLTQQISTEETILDPESPQFIAARWIATQDGERLDIPESTEDPMRFIQRYVAAVLYYSLGGNEWAAQLNFLSDDHECSWNEEIPDEHNEMFAVGLSCGPKLHIDSLLIPSNKLQGSIPDEIRYLKKLKFISLKHNQLNGHIPWALRELDMLEYLDLKYNELEGSIPDFIGEFVHLQVLGLSRNNLVGSLPHTLSTLRLKTLAVDDNTLTGDLSSVRSMTPLQYLYAQNNSFTGNVFHGIMMAQLPSLVEIDVSDNDLSASQIPSHVFSLPNLRLFDASRNNITGSIPFDIPQNNALEYLSFRGNSIGSSIPDAIANLQKLTHLDLEENSLTGAIPASLSSLQKMEYLFLGQNSFAPAPLPEAFRQMTLKELSMNKIGLQGGVPAWVGGLSHLRLLDLRENDLTGSLDQIDFSNFVSLQYLMLNNNRLTGAIPQSLGQLSSLQVLSFYHNDNLSGNMNPICTAAPSISFLGADCSDDNLCECCNECCNGNDCYNDSTWDYMETNHWDHEYARAEYAFNPHILGGGIQPRGGLL